MTLSANFQRINNSIFSSSDPQSAIVYLGQLAFSPVSIPDFLTQAADLITQVLPVGSSVIWELKEDGRNLRLQADSSAQNDSLVPLQIPLDPNSLEGVTLASVSPVIVENVLDDSRFKAHGLTLQKGWISGVSVRIGAMEKPLGVLEVFSWQRKSFSRRDVNFLQSVANLAGLVLRQAVPHLAQKKEQIGSAPATRLEWDRYDIKNRLIESRERERLRLAQDLHDSPIQDLYGMIYQLDDLRDALKEPESQKIIDECDHTLHKVVNSLRTVCRELRPPSLSPFGLEVAIRDHVEKFHDQNPDIKVHLDLMKDQQLLSDSLRLTLFRIYQQAISNVVRHAQASEVRIRFRWDKETLTMEVEDNGQGFDVPKDWLNLVHEEHFGLLDIAERVESVKGKLEIVSSTGKGTLIRVIIPHS